LAIEGRDRRITAAVCFWDGTNLGLGLRLGRIWDWDDRSPGHGTMAWQLGVLVAALCAEAVSGWSPVPAQVRAPHFAHARTRG